MKRFWICVLAVILCLGSFAGCGGNKLAEDGLTAAKNYLQSMYKDKSENTPSDYTVVGVVSVGGVAYTVEWSVKVTSGDTNGVQVVPSEDGKIVTIKVAEEAADDIVYELTATIKDAAGKTASLTFNHKVPKFQVLTWAQYIAKAKDDTVVVKGIVTALTSKDAGASYNCIYLQDNDGGYYVYGMEHDPVKDDKLEVGMEIQVSGAKDIYSGTHEIKSGSVKILNSAKTPVEPVDYTTIFANATTLQDEALVAKQAMLVTIKGVEVTGEDASSGYYKFKLGALETYVRISSSVCPLTKAEQNTFKADHASHLGWLANVTGVICVFDGNFYLTPVTVNAFEYTGLPTKTDEEAIAYEKEGLTVDTVYGADAVVTLPAAGSVYSEQVKITWTLDKEYECAQIADGKLTITAPVDEVTVKLIATLTAGEKSDTKEFELKVKKVLTVHAGTEADPFSSADAISILNTLATGATYKDADGNPIKVYIKGYVVVAGENKGNFQSMFYIADTKDAPEAERVYVYSANFTDLVKEIAKDDLVVVSGYLLDYGSVKEVGNVTVDNKKVYPEIVRKVGTNSGETAEAALSVEQVLDLAATLTSGTSTVTYNDANGAPVKFFVTGVITKIEEKSGTTEYLNNLYISDANCASMTLQVYRPYFTADGVADVSALKVGDTVVVSGYIGDYKGTKEITSIKKADNTYDNVLIISVSAATTGGNGGNTDPTDNPGTSDDVKPAASISFDKDTNLTEITDDQQIWAQSGIKFTNTKAASSTKCTNYTPAECDHVRCYQNSDIKIEYTGMTKIVFHCTGGKILSLTSNDTMKVTTSGSDVIVEFVTACNEFTITNLTVQARMTSIDVYVAAN